jgi:hypothetical protein
MKLLPYSLRILLLLFAISGLAAGCETNVAVPTPPHKPRV